MDSDSFHRLAKSLVDSGEAASIPEALNTFSGYGVRIRLASSIHRNPCSQIIALTAINVAARSFLGNVVVESDDFEFNVRGFEDVSLHQFMNWASVKHVAHRDSNQWPLISIGAAAAAPGAISAWADGWDFGIGGRQDCGAVFAPASVAAGGLAVSEAFSVLRKDNPYAGRRILALSLWDLPGNANGAPNAETPPQEGLWLLGLGHLGQAYAWTLGFMEPGAHPIVLQDADVITESTLSTSIVSHPSNLGANKTRVVAAWLEARGYKTALVERLFDDNQRAGAKDPTIALFGVDNPAARRILEGGGFRLVIDAGLGSGYKDFRAIRMRTFPGPSKAASLWAGSTEAKDQKQVQAPLAAGYQKLLADGAEPCGVTTLATRAVGAPFVGCVAAGLVLAERIRRQLGGDALGFVDMNLKDTTRPDIG